MYEYLNNLFTVIQLKQIKIRKVQYMLTMKDIIRDGHPTLRQKAAELELPLTKEEKKH